MLKILLVTELRPQLYHIYYIPCSVGFNQWRDPMKPTQILIKLCKEGKIEPPQYLSGKVKVGRHTFNVRPEDVDPLGIAKGLFTVET